MGTAVLLGRDAVPRHRGSGMDRRNDAISRHLADTLGKTTGKKIELIVVAK